MILKAKLGEDTVQKIKFFIKNSFSKCDQIRSFLWIRSHLLKKKSLMKNFIFCIVWSLSSITCILLVVAPWCRGYHYCTTSFNEAWNQVLRRYKSWHVGDLRWWEPLTMVPVRNGTKSLSPVNHSTKIIYHHH